MYSKSDKMEITSSISARYKRSVGIFKPWSTVGYISAAVGLFFLAKRVFFSSDFRIWCVFSYFVSLIVFLFIGYRFQCFFDGKNSNELKNQIPIPRFPDFRGIDLYLFEIYVTSILCMILSVFFPSFILFFTILFRILLLQIVKKIPKLYFNLIIIINAVLILAAVLKTGTHMVKNFIESDGKFTAKTSQSLQDFSQIIALILLFLIFNAILPFAQKGFDSRDPFYYVPFVLSLIALAYMNSFIIKAMRGENVFAFLTNLENITETDELNEENMSFRDVITSLLVAFLFFAFLPEFFYYGITSFKKFVVTMFQVAFYVTQKVFKGAIYFIYLIASKIF